MSAIHNETPSVQATNRKLRVALVFSGQEIFKAFVAGHITKRGAQGEAHVQAFKNQCLNNYALRKSQIAQSRIDGEKPQS